MNYLMKPDTDFSDVSFPSKTQMDKEKSQFRFSTKPDLMHGRAMAGNPDKRLEADGNVEAHIGPEVWRKLQLYCVYVHSGI